MAFWKMGVGITIKNNSLKFGSRFNALLSASFTSGNSFTYDNAGGGYSDGLVKLVAVNDKITVGPSTASTFEGATQVFTVASVNGTTITTDESASVQFADNDPVSGIGSKLPGGWSSSDTTSVTVGGLSSASLSSSLSNRGYQDRFRFNVRCDNGVVTLTYRHILDEFIASTVHRFGLRYQSVEVSGSPSFSFTIVDPGAAWKVVASRVASTTWIDAEDTGNSPSSKPAYFEFSCLLTAVSSAIIDVLMDNIYLEHAKNTSGEANGVYTFSDYPAFGSRKWSNRTGHKIASLRNNARILVQTSGGADRARKQVVTAQFKDVSRTLREQLSIFEEWQLRGYPLVFHHDIPSIEPNLYGYLTIKDTSLTHWSIEKCSFDFLFEEM